MQQYYVIKSQKIYESAADFLVELDGTCPVYIGHFPGNPIAPGACNIEMIRQCACIAMGKEIRIAEIKVCKFLMLLQPQNHKELTIQLTWSGSKCMASILANDRIAAQLKMVLI